ncbi:MAG TPA: AAA family ATPase [Leptospiraceae bacterium]|nr:AAA family ATPase [Leptospiraceae bacterium]HRG75406.1 AAA family ATPase [Leptospiraceae bacterium]
MTKNLTIKNFKSIKEMNIECKRINLFIGKPNVGKSNILEALSIFDLPYAINQGLILNDLIRHTNAKNFFYDNQTKDNATVYMDSNSVTMRYDNSSQSVEVFCAPSHAEINYYIYDDTENFSKLLQRFIKTNKNIKYFYSNQSYMKFFQKYSSNIRYYVFNKRSQFNLASTDYLLPPYGQNLFSIIRENTQVSDEVAEYFLEYGLQWAYDEEANLFLSQKQIKNTIYKYPFSSIADTLQRMIFYTTAIETNKDCILVFEEPETNSFPPYTRDLAYKIAANQENQYFISTHSPYLLLNLIENTPKDELNIFVTYYENYETKVKALSSDEIKSLLDDSVDIFFNLDKFVAGA